MSNSKIKAQDLKDSYVAGLIEAKRSSELPGAMVQPVVETAGRSTDLPGAMVQPVVETAGLSGKLGSELGQTAGVVVDLQNGAVMRGNDANPRFVIRDGNRRMVMRDQSAAYPITNLGHGAFDIERVTPSGMREGANILHGGSNNVDYTVYDGRQRWHKIGQMYDEQMSMPFNR